MNPTGTSTRRAFVGALLGSPIVGWAADRVVPPIMLAERYRENLIENLTQFWVSEKLDGVRAYWTGSTLLTRAGNPIAAPTWFTDRLPPLALDGELWGGRGTFERTSGVVRTASPRDGAWRQIKYMVFDLPQVADVFDERLRALRSLVARTRSEALVLIEQARATTSASLHERLREVEAANGEGLMLHRGPSLYLAGRSNDLLKLKSAADAEARVLAHLPGNGKYAGMLGALVVEREDGAQFRIGSGFTDRERATPPPIGSWVTYAYDGETNSGLPRFARFVRVRTDDEANPR